MGTERGNNTTVIGLNTKAGADNTKYKLNSETQDSITANRELVVKLEGSSKLHGRAMGTKGRVVLWSTGTQHRAEGSTPHTQQKSELAVIVYKQFNKV